MILVDELARFEQPLHKKYFSTLEKALEYIKTGTMKYKVSQVIGNDVFYICSIYPSLKKDSLDVENYLLKFVEVRHAKSILTSISPLKPAKHIHPGMYEHTLRLSVTYHTEYQINCSWEEILQKLESYL